jgi:hypothetical protein
MADLSFLPTKIQLSAETLACTDRRKRGLSFEHDWQSQLGTAMEPIYGSSADGRSIISKQNVDAKLLLSDYAYLSHAEHCYGEKNGMIYAGYVEHDGVAYLCLAVTWQQLNEHNSFQRFWSGRPSNGEAPWSFSLGSALALNLL